MVSTDRDSLPLLTHVVVLSSRYANVLLASLNGRHRYRVKDSTMTFVGKHNLDFGHGTQSKQISGFDHSISGAMDLPDGTASKASHLVVVHPSHQSDVNSVRSAVDSKPSGPQLDLERGEGISSTMVQDEGEGGPYGRKVSVSLTPPRDIVVLVEREVHRDRFSPRRT